MSLILRIKTTKTFKLNDFETEKFNLDKLIYFSFCFISRTTVNFTTLSPSEDASITTCGFIILSKNVRFKIKTLNLGVKFSENKKERNTDNF